MQGWSDVNRVHTGCDYVGVHNDSAAADLDADISVFCRLELPNQPPFILWDSPEDEAVYASGSQVTFDANRSWDLDFDELDYSWSSSIDGDLLAACGQPSGGNGSWFTANLAVACLSDGVHQITLEVCDSQSQCVQGLSLIHI